MNYLSLFSGIGGFDLAFQRVGMQCVGMCEIDKSCKNVLHKHFEYVHIFDDVKQIGASDYERGAVDLICGGFPCQDLSIAGKRAGLAGERSGLWYEFARVINELEPRWVVIENVPGLLSSNKGKDFATIIRWLVERGYGVCWRVLDAQYFGVPQRRKRVFIVASFGNGRAAEVLFESEGMSGNTPPRREAGEGTAKTIIINTANSGTNQNNVKITDTLDTLDTLNSFAVMAHGQANAEIVKDGSPSLTGNHEAPIVFPTLNAQYNKNAGSNQWFDNRQFIWEMSNASEAVRESGDVVPTLQSRMGTGGNQVPMVGIRRLTPLECERLQGFPDGWTEGQPDTQRYRQLGNAVAVPVVEWIAKRIVKVNEQKLP